MLFAPGSSSPPFFASLSRTAALHNFCRLLRYFACHLDSTAFRWSASVDVLGSSLGPTMTSCEWLADLLSAGQSSFCIGHVASYWRMSGSSCRFWSYLSCIGVFRRCCLGPLKPNHPYRPTSSKLSAWQGPLNGAYDGPLILESSRWQSRCYQTVSVQLFF